MSLWQEISSQFGKPSGAFGRIAGFIITNRTSNVERNEWEITFTNQAFRLCFGNRLWSGRSDTENK